MSKDAQGGGGHEAEPHHHDSLPLRGNSRRSQEENVVNNAAPQRGVPQEGAQPISVAIDPVALITTECITITSAMRKHTRWAHSSVSAILGSGLVTPISPLQATREKVIANGTSTKREQDARLSKGEYLGESNLANRWGLRGKKGKSIQDNPLMAGFGRLRRELVGCKDIRKFDTPSLLHPFLQVIQASATSAPITSLALVAITKFFSYNLICIDSPRLALAMQSLSSAITHCRFEASDSAADEIVLLRILNLMERMLSGPGGDLLSDESVCEMMETGLSMCCQARLSEVLRRSAEISMIKMCQTIFERLKYLEVEAGEHIEALDEQTKDDMDAVKMDPSSNNSGAVAVPPRDSEEATPLSSVPLVGQAPASSGEGLVAPAATTSADNEIKPYSLPSIRELFRVLVDLLDPHDRQHSDAMRVMALRIIDVALEVAGPSIAKHPTLAMLAEDRLCRHLFQLVRSDNMAILHESLIVAGTLLSTCRDVLKLQQELFLSYMVACLHPRVEIPREAGIDPSLYAGIPQAPSLVKPPPSQANSGRSTPVPVKDRQKLGLEGGARKPDAREAMVESVGALARIPSFMVELFVNYDCEVDRSDLCEDMVGLLSRNAIPDSATWSTTSVPPLCLDALLTYVQFIDDRLNDETKAAGFPDPARLREQRRLKRIIVKGTSKFNEHPKSGLAYLASQGIISDINDPHSVATFLKGTSRVSKKVLGEFLSKKGNEAVLEAFLDLFDFSEKKVHEALRGLLEAFRLPGESALIERIVTSFSEKYCNPKTPEGVADKDAVYVLTYAIIMLNTDQHNPNVKSTNRMTFTDFCRNLRGVNGGQDFAPEYLQDIFDSIKSNEIILPDEHDNKHAFDYAWKELLLKTDTAGRLKICDTNLYDADMFAATWKPVVATLSYVFMSASDDSVFHRVIQGFDQCARIASKYGMTEVLDQIVYCLSYISTLATDAPPSTALNTEVQVEDGSVMVSELAVKFGRDFRAQLATVVLFRIINGNEGLLQNSWKYVARIWTNLYTNSLIEPFSPGSPNSQWDIAPIPLQSLSQVIERGQKNNESGIFSAFTSYITSYAADDPPEPSEEELDSTLCTVGCINTCNMTDIFAHTQGLSTQSVRRLVAALLSQLPDDNSSRSSTESPEVDLTSGQRTGAEGPAYDAGVVYVLEFCTILATRNEDSAREIASDVVDALQSIIRIPDNYHQITVARTVYYLLHLLQASYEFSTIRIPLVLHTISHFKPALLEKSSSLVLKGLQKCINRPSPLRNEMVTSPDFWVILRTLAQRPDVSPIVFSILEEVTVGQLSIAVLADNYEPAVALLNDYASAGSVGAASEQAQDRKSKRGAPAKPPKAKMDDVVQRAVKAVSIIYQLTSRIPALMEQSHLERNEAWNAYWSPIFQGLTAQCINPCREVRHQAYSSLQRCLLSDELKSGMEPSWTALFDEVLFPLIFKLLKPEVYSTDPVGMSETRVQAATLICRIFLYYLPALSAWHGMLDLWLEILDVMDRLMHSGQGDSLEEAVPESLKNILLVMSTSDYLAPMGDESRQKLWAETWKRLDRFLPELRKQVETEVQETEPVLKDVPQESQGAAQA